MANEKIISPGVFTRENDQSFLQKGIEQIGAALVGPTAKGPAFVPTTVTTYSEYTSIFGSKFKSGSDYFQYQTSYAAREYFANGGKKLIVVSIKSGSYGPATSSVNTSLTASVQSFTLTTLSDGFVMNNTGGEVSGSLISGSIDNVKWEVSNVNNATGNFTLLIRRGDDNAKQKVVLESWSNISLDPTQPNFISQVIGDSDNVLRYDSNGTSAYIQTTGSYTNKSKYVRVSSVITTPNYLDNNGTFVPMYTGSLPASGSGSFGGASDGTISAVPNFNSNIIDGATNSQGYTAASYRDALALLSNQDEYDFNLLLLPGLITSTDAISPVSSLLTGVDAVSICENRGDCFLIVDPVGYNSNISSVTTAAQAFNTNYAGAYWPWVQIRDNELGRNVWVPASTVVGGIIAFNDQVAAEWFAPAGLNRGGIPSVIQAERKLPSSDRDTLYSNSINPLASFPGQGVVAYGQKTLQKRPSALDRINVRRLLITLKKFISSSSRYLVFEQNTNATRNKFLSIVNPYLESVVQRQGLYAFKVVMDDTNNTPDVIDRNQLVGSIWIQPTKTAEFIILDFNLLPTGATFPQ